MHACFSIGDDPLVQYNEIIADVTRDKPEIDSQTIQENYGQTETTAQLLLNRDALSIM